MIWSRRDKVFLVVGVALWASALALTPREIAAALRRERVGPRTVLVVLVYAVATACVLRGLPRRDGPPDLPRS